MTEDQVELETINWLVDTGYTHICGYDIGFACLPGARLKTSSSY